MSYLIANDYVRSITDVSLQQVIAGNAYLQTWAELTAIKQVSNYLRQKYDVDTEFSNTLQYDPTKVYKANNRVYLNASPYSSSATYALKALVLQAGKVYQCKTAITIGEAFGATKWDLLGDQYEMLYALYPEPLFNINGFYSVGDKVFWKDKTYTAKVATRILTHGEAIQFADYSNIPYRNLFPDAVNSTDQWQVEGDYSVPAGSLIDETKWVRGDNRHPQLLMYLIDVVIYHLYCRTAPKAVPETRIDRYNAVIAELRMIARGEIASDIQKLQPDAGARIRWGSNVKQQNSY